MQNASKQDDLHQLAGKLISPNNWFLSTNNNTEVELKASAHVHTNGILFLTLNLFEGHPAQQLDQAILL